MYYNCVSDSWLQNYVPDDSSNILLSASDNEVLRGETPPSDLGNENFGCINQVDDQNSPPCSEPALSETDENDGKRQ